MKKAKFLVFVAVAVVAIATAGAAEPKNSIGVFLNFLWPGGDYTTSVEGTTLTLEAQEATGYGLSYRYAFHPKWDFGASFFYADHDVDGTLSGVGSAKVATVSWTPILLDANWHFGKKGLFYVGPTIGYAMWDKLKWVTTEIPTVDIKDTFVYGLDFGADVPFGERWTLNVNARYLQVEAETDTVGGDITIDVNPWILAVGVSYRF